MLNNHIFKRRERRKQVILQHKQMPTLSPDPVIPKRRHLCYSRAIIAIITSQAALVGIMKQIPLPTREAHLARALGISRINPAQENNCVKRILLDNVGDEVEESGRRLIQKEHVIDSGGFIVL